MAFAGTDEQREVHVEDSAECLRHDLLVTGLEQSDPALLDVYASEQYSTYQWLKEVGVSFGEPHAGSGQTVPRSHPVDTWHLVDTLARRARPAEDESTSAPRRSGCSPPTGAWSVSWH